MKKNHDKIFRRIEIDPVSGEYFIQIPESLMNELEWYEDTEIEFVLEGSDLILSEVR